MSLSPTVGKSLNDGQAHKFEGCEDFLEAM